MFKKLWTVLLAVILCAGAALSVSLAEEQEVFLGSFSTEKTYSGDLLFYALQMSEQVESYREIVVTVYETASDTPVFSFRPDRASDHWGICWSGTAMTSGFSPRIPARAAGNTSTGNGSAMTDACVRSTSFHVGTAHTGIIPKLGLLCIAR